MKLVIAIYLPNDRCVFYSPDDNGKFLVAVDKKNAKVYSTIESAYIDLNELISISPKMSAEIHDENRFH